MIVHIFMYYRPNKRNGQNKGSSGNTYGSTEIFFSAFFLKSFKNSVYFVKK